jgi:hypothetical protein
MTFVSYQIGKQNLTDFVCSKSTLPRLVKSTARVRSPTVKNSVAVII